MSDALRPSPLNVMIGCDCDHDRARFNRRIGRGDVSWEGFTRIYERFNGIRADVLKRTQANPVLTLNVRADEHVYHNTGSYDHCLKLFTRSLKPQADPDDELAWHHHSYIPRDGVLVQNLDDTNWLREHIRRSWDAISPFGLKTLHAGWCYQTTEAMNAYSDVGVSVDYSALPGMANTKGTYCRYDYGMLKSCHPYLPSRLDYQQPSDNTRDGILEVPVTTADCGAFNIGLFLNVLQKSGRLDLNLLRTPGRFVQIDANPLLFRPFLRAVFRSRPDLPYFATYFHADELLPNSQKSRASCILYGGMYLLRNLLYVLDTARRHGRTVRFTTFGEFARLWKSRRR